MPEDFSNSRGIRFLFFGETIPGMILRGIALVVLIAMSTLISAKIQSLVSGSAPTMEALFLIFFVVAVPMVFGLISSELPRGDENAFLRIGGATFCRTGMPLLAVLLLSYSTHGWLLEMGMSVCIVYAVGLLVSILISVYRLGCQTENSKSDEVKSVVH